MSNFLCKLVIAKQLILKTRQQNYYGSKNKEKRGLSKLLSVKTRMSDDLFLLFDKFGRSLVISPVIIDDTMLGENSVRMQGISRVFNHIKGRYVLGYKLLLRASFDSKTTIPFDFSSLQSNLTTYS